MNLLIDKLYDTKTKYKDKSAITDKDGSISFEKLYRDVITVSTYLSNLNINDSPVFVYMPKCKEAVVAMLGIVASGNFYTPTDVNFPISKPKKIYEKLKPALTITTEKYKNKCLEMGIPELDIVLFENLFTDDDLVDRKYVDIFSEEQLGYVLFTSGSTGEPKGVMIKRNAIDDYISWAVDCFKVNSTDSICNQAPFYFDNSTLDIYLMIYTGATLHIIPESYFMFPAKLMKYVSENAITTIFWVPSVFRLIQGYDLLSRYECKSLNKILFAGEVMHNKELNYWRDRIPDALYANLYGPTEITVDCTYYIVDRKFEDDEPLPIGKARSNVDVMLFDEKNDLITKPDTKGELCVSGLCLAKGYWMDDIKTSKVFVVNPLDNNVLMYRTGDIVHYNESNELIFDGRLDGQIKYNGCRIELGEIENMVLAIPYINETCAIFDKEENKIILYCIVSEDTTEKELQSAVQKTLPKYMIPNKICILEKFPLNDNGKIDRKQLRMKNIG